MTVFVVDTQVHGYLRGHQLLSSSVDLPKVDQSVIDRLSDVAGPLRPNEKFEPYLSGYHLPSGDRYVLARTWQDLTVTRAGCVRTLSLIIPVSDWASAKSLAPFLDLLAPSSFPEAAETEAHRITPSSLVRPIAPVPDFRAGEFLEALFLEESKPVAVFGAPTPELIATRLLTAVWSDFRRQFAFSTFARSPRRIEGRPFDLVFAPKDARSKFADWPGRRIDGAADNTARHRWTSDIVERVFMAPLPRLLSERDVARAGPNDAKTAALLRISLLWDELVRKIDTTPTAALGLLDIADSRGVWNSDTLDALDSAIEIAVRSAIAGMSPDQAWEFTTALVRKMRGHGLQNGRLNGARGSNPDQSLFIVTLIAPCHARSTEPQAPDTHWRGIGFAQRCGEQRRSAAATYLLTFQAGAVTWSISPRVPLRNMSHPLHLQISRSAIACNVPFRLLGLTTGH